MLRGLRPDTFSVRRDEFRSLVRRSREVILIAAITGIVTGLFVRGFEYLVEVGCFERRDPPLWVLPLPSAGGCGGVLFLPTRAQRGKVALHNDGLLVGERDDLFPESLDFVHGIVEARGLTLSLSREAVVPDAAFERLRARLKASFLEGLRQLPDRQPGTARLVLEAYDHVLKVGAVNDDELLAAVADHLPVRLVSGPSVPLSELVDDGRIRFVDDAAQQGHLAALQAKKGAKVVDAQDRLTRALIHKYAMMTNGVETVRADRDVGDELDEAMGKPWPDVERLFRHATGERYEPRAVRGDGAVPAFVAGSRESELLDLLDGLPDGNEEARRMKELFGGFLRHQGQKRTRPLFLDTTHPLMEALARGVEQALDPDRLRTVARAVAATARGYSEDHLTHADRRQVVEDVADALHLVLAPVSPDRKENLR